MPPMPNFGAKNFRHRPKQVSAVAETVGFWVGGAKNARSPSPATGSTTAANSSSPPWSAPATSPSRLLALHDDADVVWGPETVDRSMIGTTRTVSSALSTVDFTRLSSNGSHGPRKDQKESVIFRLHPAREGKKLIFQMGTSDPERAVEAAKLIARDVAGIDVDAGCPKPFSTSGGMGAALLRTPDKLCAILEALVANVASEFEIGISVKIRLLETREETETGGAEALRDGDYGADDPLSDDADEATGEGNQGAMGVACLANGDVTNPEDAQELVNTFGVEGAMIATAAETNPSCFRRKEDGGLAPWREVVELYLRTSMEVENRWGNTKYLLGHLVPGQDPVYRGVTGSKSYTGICELLGFPELVERAKEVDHALGLDVVPVKQGKKKQNSTADAAGGQSGKKEKRKPLSTRGVENSKPAVGTSKPAVQSPAVSIDIPQPAMESALAAQLV
ncbi:hypothetical protein VE04_07530 [Pseudogymnoascus sp. 24MN13]|nr:hypothetical protein VE04_07530 [Pseudogymnoascus sp. 24MN13]